MSTRRNFIKGLFEGIGAILGMVGAKIVLKNTPDARIRRLTSEESADYKKNGPRFDWTCSIRLNQHQRPLQGRIVNIDYKNKIFTVHTESLVVAEKEGLTQKPYGEKPAGRLGKPVKKNG